MASVVFIDDVSMNMVDDVYASISIFLKFVLSQVYASILIFLKFVLAETGGGIILKFVLAELSVFLVYLFVGYYLHHVIKATLLLIRMLPKAYTYSSFFMVYFGTWNMLATVVHAMQNGPNTAGTNPLLLLGVATVGGVAMLSMKGPRKPADGDDDGESEKDAELGPSSMCRTRKGSGWFAATTKEPSTTEEPSRKRPHLEEASWTLSDGPTSPKDATISTFNRIMAMEQPFYISGDDTRLNINYPRDCFPQAVIEDVVLLTKRYWAPLDEWIRDNKLTRADFRGKTKPQADFLNKCYGQALKKHQSELVESLLHEFQSDEFKNLDFTTNSKARKAAWKVLKKWETKNYVVLATTPNETTKLGLIDGDSSKQLVAKEDLAETLWQLHTCALGVTSNHSARTSKQEKKENYIGITDRLVAFFVTCCEDSRWGPPKKPKPGNTPIRSTRVMERVQIDLIVLTSALPERNADYKYVLTIKDHFSKFVWLRPLRHKRVADVVAGLRGVFDEYGPPTILQADNGGEFRGLGQTRQALTEVVNNRRATEGLPPLPTLSDTEHYYDYVGFHDCDMDAIATSFKEMYPDMVQVHGAVNSSSTQGSVENANQHVQRHLFELERAWSIQHPGDAGVWVIHLSTVAKLMNSKVSCGVRNVSPFQVMFARPPSQVLPPGMAQLSQDMRKALRTVDELEDAVRLLPEGQHLLERLWARPILGATNSLLCSAYTDQQDHLLTYQKLVRASNLGERLEEADVKTIVCDSAQGSSIVGSIVEPNEHVHAMVHTMVEAVATVRAPWRAMTDGVSLLTTLGLKIVHGLADGNCFGDAFLKTAHSGLAVACVCVSCPSSILEFR